MKRRLALLLIALLALSTVLFVAACDDGQRDETQGSTVAYDDLTSTGKEQNTYAELFSIEHFKDEDNNEYSKIDVFDKNKELNTSWFLLPEGVDSVAEGETGVAVAGTIKDVHKYSAPDYEQILTIGEEKNVTFAVFSTMIDYVPEVYDQLTGTCGLRIMRDQSSSESHPLARTEWIKIYGEIFDMREESDAVFNEQVAILNETAAKIDVPEAERKTVLIFYTAQDGVFNVRNAADYVTELVSLAGGRQVAEIGAGKSGNTKMTQEEFIELCSEADYILYNWTSGASGVAGETLDALIEARLGDWFRDFKACKGGNVWRTSNDFYQKMDKMGEMVADIYEMLYGENVSDNLTYVNRLK